MSALDIKQEPGFIHVKRKINFFILLKNRWNILVIIGLFLSFVIYALTLNAIVTILLVLTILVFVIYLPPQKKHPLTLDLNNRLILVNNQSIPVTENSVIRLTRKFTKKTYRSQNSRKTRYFSKWHLYLDDSLLVYHKSQSDSTGTRATHFYNQPWIDELAELIAETFNITLIDETGDEPVTRKVGETDTPLHVYLVTNNPELKQPEFSFLQPKYYVIKKEPNQITIELKNRYSDFRTIIYMSLFLFLYYKFTTIFLDYKAILTTFTMTSNDLVFMILFFILFILIILPFSNGTLRKFSIKINPNYIILTTHGLFWPLKKQKIPLNNVEKIVKYNTLSQLYALELITDHGRFQLTGSLDHNEITELEDLVKRALVHVHSLSQQPIISNLGF